jgi:hypothetical protein
VNEKPKWFKLVARTVQEGRWVEGELTLWVNEAGDVHINRFAPSTTLPEPRQTAPTEWGAALAVPAAPSEPASPEPMYESDDELPSPEDVRGILGKPAPPPEASVETAARAYYEEFRKRHDGPVTWEALAPGVRRGYLADMRIALTAAEAPREPDDELPSAEDVKGILGPAAPREAGTWVRVDTLTDKDIRRIAGAAVHADLTQWAAPAGADPWIEVRKALAASATAPEVK